MGEPAKTGVVTEQSEEEELVTRLIDKASTFSFAGDYQMTLQILVPIEALKMASIDSLQVKGGALYSLGRHEEALAAYERAIELDPELAAGARLP